MRTTAPPANKEETTTDQTKSRGLDGDVATYLPVYRFSGHQSFPLRSSWLPKAIREITDGKDPLNHVDAGIVSLGLGKNMVHALRCWIEAFQVAVFTPTGWKLSPVGNLVLSPGGLDPHLEDHATSWLLHWLIATTPVPNPFFAWECLFNRWPSPEFSASTVIEAFRKEADNRSRGASTATIKQHWEVFLHSYRPPSGNNAGEDHLESVLSVLGLVREAGERQNASGRWETVFSFDLGPKRGISQQLFAYFLHDWWNRRFHSEETAPVREVVGGAYSPGRILKMSEAEIVRRLADLANLRGEAFTLTESASLRQVRRERNSDGFDELRAAYESPRFL